MILILFILLAVVSHSVEANSCLKNWDQTQHKIDELMHELICANQNDWEDCYQNFRPQKMETPFHQVEDKELLILCETSHMFNQVNSLGWITTPMRELSAKLSENYSLKNPLAKNYFINSAEEFYHHMQLHRARVVELATNAYKKFPHLFPELTLEQVQGVMKVHDYAKVDFGTFASNGQHYFQVLYGEGYGKKLPANWVNELNAADNRFMEQAYKNFMIDTPTKKEQILKLEKIADLVDRVNNSVSPEEFGRKMYPVSGSLQGDKIDDVVKHLEKSYLKITKKHLFKPLTKSEYRRLYFGLRGKQILWGISHQEQRKLSMKAMRSLVGLDAKGALLKIGNFMAKESTAKLFMVANGLGLFLSDMERLGCDENGHFDWIKDNGICKPLLGLTPKLVDYLNLSEDEQKKLMRAYSNQCAVIEGTQKLQEVTRFKEKECLTDGVRLKLPDNKGELFVHEKDGAPSKIIFDSGRKNSRIYPIVEERFTGNMKSKETCIIQKMNKNEECIISGNEKKINFINRDFLTSYHEATSNLRFYILKELASCKR